MFDVSITFDGINEVLKSYQIASAAFEKVADLLALCENDCFMELQRSRGVSHISISVWVDGDGSYMSIMRHTISVD